MDNTHNHDRDHECQDHDQDHEGEISISFAPRFDDLARHGISPEQFESALLIGLEEFETLLATADLNAEELNLEKIVLRIDGKEFQLSDLADVEINDDLEADFDEEEDDDEGELDEKELDG